MKALAMIDLNQSDAAHFENLKDFVDKAVNGFNHQLRAKAKVTSMRLLSEKRRRAVEDITLGRQRCTLAELIVGVTESMRDDCLPYLTTWEFFQTLLILKAMCELDARGAEGSAHELSHLTTLPVQMVEKRLRELAEVGAVENGGVGYLLTPEFFNNEALIRGFKLRRAIVSIASEKMRDDPNEHRRSN